jgi:hypothetical protein
MDAIAHDFNNLMMVVIGHAHRLQQQLALHPAKREIDLISQAGLRAAARCSNPKNWTSMPPSGTWKICCSE